MFRQAPIAAAVVALSIIPAAADPSTKRVIAFEQRVREAARAMDMSPRLRDLAPDQRRRIVEFVAGNVLFALLHEMGHAHITEMGLVVLGREEDAADSFAVLTMLKVGSSFSREVLVQASLGWFLSAYRDEKERVRLSFYDEHGLDRQRAYGIVCLMVGSDPDKFTDLAKMTKLPEERQRSCLGDYSTASWSWEQVMKPHRRTSDQPKNKIEVVYDKAEGELVAFQQLFRSIELLETIADVASEEYVWRRPFTLGMQSCGAPGAHWDLSQRKLVVCYELAAEFAMLYRQYTKWGVSPY